MCRLINKVKMRFKRKISEEIRTISPYKRQDLLRYGHSDPRLSVSFQSQTRWMAGEWKSWLKLTPLLDSLSLSLAFPLSLAYRLPPLSRSP